MGRYLMKRILWALFADIVGIVENLSIVTVADHVGIRVEQRLAGQW